MCGVSEATNECGGSKRRTPPWGGQVGYAHQSSFGDGTYRAWVVGTGKNFANTQGTGNARPRRSGPGDLDFDGEAHFTMTARIAYDASIENIRVAMNNDVLATLHGVDAEPNPFDSLDRAGLEIKGMQCGGARAAVDLCLDYREHQGRDCNPLTPADHLFVLGCYRYNSICSSVLFDGVSH